MCWRSADRAWDTAGSLTPSAFAAAVTDPSWRLVYLSIALCCGAVAVYALRDVRGHQ
jgi:hypothetical protein